MPYRYICDILKSGDLDL